MSTPLHVFEHAAVDRELDKAINGAIEYLRREDDYGAVARRIVTEPAEVCAEVFGIFVSGGYGYGGWFTTSEEVSATINSLSFVRFFVGHELLDDGAPGIALAKYNMNKGRTEFLSAVKRSQALPSPEFPSRLPGPFVTSSVERLRMEADPEAKLAWCDDILAVFDWHVAHQASRRAYYVEDDQDVSCFDKIDAPTLALRAWVDSLNLPPLER